MGSRPNAYLGFGVVIDEDEWEDRFGEADDWEDAAAAALGVSAPTEPWSEETKALYHKFWDDKRKALESAGCEIEMDGCDGEGARYACAILHHTDWDEPLVISDESLKATNEDRDRLARFMSALGLTMKEEPRWILFAYYDYG